MPAADGADTVERSMRASFTGEAAENALDAALAAIGQATPEGATLSAERADGADGPGLAVAFRSAEPNCAKQALAAALQACAWAATEHGASVRMRAD